MTEATLCFPLRGTDGVTPEEVLLIEKRRGLGEGWYNGPGGKLEAEETPRECAIRETREEVGLEVDPAALEKAAELTFRLDGDVHTVCHVYRADRFEGEPVTTPEARPEWFSVEEIPYDQMWEDDRLWLPGVLSGRTVVGEFAFEGGPPLDEADFVDHDLEWDVPITDGSTTRSRG
ncbi:8-oxo-dGTP diphosphatase [Natrarchaeobaculum sulfurireducens]|uniref:Oxidized purine nucleoside triphosphate hydrolase n=1 Tax=Natrarchaeobaculum sulfurireducens TaxID=2044521 RepID=A0A346PFZ4_9EURY|nr:8-oxo-dGTP diphosphatase [Natrarchaeobaculum sulfurireducens]AXR78439.1 NUDIX family hydrolase [Natrarchaeobaculum sulfurireducens]